MRAPYECDLHTHTNRSDGADTYEELIEHAVERGLKVLAITDHDITPLSVVETENGAVPLKEYGRDRGISIIPGIEFSCNTEIEDVHVVGLGCDFSHPGFAAQEQKTVESKIKGYSLLCEKLTEQGMPVSMEAICTYKGRNISQEEVQKKMIFEYMADKGYAEDWSKAKLMVKNTPSFQIKREKPEAEDMIRLIKESGGIAVLAHPYLIEEAACLSGEKGNRTEYIDRLIEAGLDGIEGAYPYNKTSYGGTLTPKQIEAEIRERYTDRVRFISGGSDYHGDRKKGLTEAKCRDLGEKGLSYDEFMKTPLRRLIEEC